MWSLGDRQLQISIAGLPFPQAHLSTKGLSGKLAVCQAGEGYRWFIPRHLCQIRHEILFEETPIRFAIMELRLGRKCRASSACTRAISRVVRARCDDRAVACRLRDQRAAAAGNASR